MHNDHNDMHDLHLKEFLHTYDSCFKDEIPNELPPIRGDDDHRIELIQGSSPPNRAPIEYPWPNKRKSWPKYMNY